MYKYIFVSFFLNYIPRLVSAGMAIISRKNYACNKWAKHIFNSYFFLIFLYLVGVRLYKNCLYRWLSQSFSATSSAILSGVVFGVIALFLLFWLCDMYYLWTTVMNDSLWWTLPAVFTCFFFWGGYRYPCIGQMTFSSSFKDRLEEAWISDLRP